MIIIWIDNKKHCHTFGSKGNTVLYSSFVVEIMLLPLLYKLNVGVTTIFLVQKEKGYFAEIALRTIILQFKL